MHQLDSLDRKLIHLLQQDGRATYVELARDAGISEATARRRVERLLSEGIIQILACLDPHQVGLGVEALVYLETDLDKLTQIGRQLARMPEVREVVYTLGNFNIVVRLILPSSDNLLPFLTERVAPISGIKATHTAYLLQVEKSLHNWQLPEVPLLREEISRGPLILLVDDDTDFIAASKMVLEAEGYQVVVACTGSEALDCLQEAQPALILLDVIMESVPLTLEVAQALGAGAQQWGISVLALSSLRASEWASMLPPEQKMPFDGFLQKPLEPEVLVETVRNVIGR